MLHFDFYAFFSQAAFEVSGKRFENLNKATVISDLGLDSVALIELVVLLTPHSVDRPWVLLEVGAAWVLGARKRITPILCHVDVEPIPGLLKSKKAIHINDCANLFAEVKRRVESHHG